MYGKAVVNKGESFVNENGQWTDWADYDKKPNQELVDGLAQIGIEVTPDMVVTDNFSIKLYVVAEAETKYSDTAFCRFRTDSGC